MLGLKSLTVILLALLAVSVCRGHGNGHGNGHNEHGNGQGNGHGNACGDGHGGGDSHEDSHENNNGNGHGHRNCHRYCRRPTYGDCSECDPETYKESVTCANAMLSPNPITIADLGDLYTYWGEHFNVMGSRYYFSKIAEGMRYDCPTNITHLKRMKLITPWSGIYGAIAVDGACGYDRLLLRRCTFPTADYPFLCTFDQGNPPTCGLDLGTLSYVAVKTDMVNHRWTLFFHCWNAPRPSAPNAEPTAVTFNVFSLDQTLSPTDRQLILDTLVSYGFDISPDNLIEPDFTDTTPC